MQKQKVKQVNVSDVVNEQLENVEAVYVPVPTIRTHYNSMYFPRRYEVNNDPSMTVPDEAMSIIELMDRYAHGVPLSKREGVFHGEESELPNDLDRLDLAEREEILRGIAERRDEILENVKERRAKAAEKRLQDQVDARVKAKEEEKAKFEELKKKFEGGQS